jgi:Fe2+ transport system protein B
MEREKTPKPTIVLIGKESVGKSQLVASLTGSAARSSNFRGSTIHCESYRIDEREFVDTPGILRRSDSETTRAAIARMQQSDVVLLVAQATHLDDDLRDLLPLAKAKRGAVAVTFWDKIEPNFQASQTIQQLSRESGLSLIPVDARSLTDAERESIFSALDNPPAITEEKLQASAGWRIQPRATWLETPIIGQLLAALLLILPAIVAVYIANHAAEILDPVVQAALKPLSQLLDAWPSLLKGTFAGSYGLLTMGPLLFVWAVPTVILYALILGAYKASGLLDRLSTAMNPVLRPVGLSGRDLVRVLMGFGCNVPAVIATRACSSCSRGACISAIAFGAACSYQLGSTLGVFAAAGKAWLAAPYLLYLTLTTLIYTRMTAPREARSQLNVLVTEGRVFLEWPRPAAIWREARASITGFFKNALPIFVLICVVAALLDWLGVLQRLATFIAPVMKLFHLPAEAALPVVMASIRKDGILLLAQPELAAQLSAGQVLTGVYLAGVLLPCLVTALTIAREQSPRFALKLLARQAAAAIFFSLLLAWGFRW